MTTSPIKGEKNHRKTNEQKNKTRKKKEKKNNKLMGAENPKPSIALLITFQISVDCSHAFFTHAWQGIIFQKQIK